MIICIVGPTGVGKTKLSVELAKKYNAIIINCDAMQVYKDLNIGTAKITEEEKEVIQHYLFDIRDVNEEYSVFDYQKDARKLIEENKDKNIIFVGGTGLYLKAALYDYRFNKEEEQNNYEDLTNEELYELAKKKDEKMNIHPNNRVRLIRFLNKTNEEKVEPIPLYEHTIIGLTTDRDKLYERINKRVDKMIDEGLLDEAYNIYESGIRSKSVMTPIGPKELFEYFEKKISLEEAINNIKSKSRKYAKRQYTWFRNQLPVVWFDVCFDNFQNTVDEVILHIK